MKELIKKVVFAFCVVSFNVLIGQNQTETLSPVLSENLLPFSLQIEQASFTLPAGVQAFASAAYDGKWVLIGGRTNGLHGFDNIGNNFPPRFQNKRVFVVDPKTGITKSRLLKTQNSGLSQNLIDTLTTTASEFFQKGSTLYLVGGYGINHTTGQMETKSTLSAINLKKLIRWVSHETPSLKKAIRQISHPILQVAGGFLFQNDDHSPFLLIFGQNFSGLYRDNSNGIYTEQVRSFWLNDDGKNLAIFPNPSKTTTPDYRRRDLNILPVMHRNQPGYVVLAGVFTLDTGVWTVPVLIKPNGSSFEPNPNSPNTFKQAMNHYDCATFGLYSTHTEDMYAILPGGISFGFFSGGQFQTDSEIPFINQVTTIKIDKHNHFSQYLMNGEYPFIASTGINHGNQLLFGAEAQFFLKDGISTYHNGVIQLDKLKVPTVIGYIVGGIMSTLPNTNTSLDSTSSPYVFTVKLIPKY